MKNNPHIQRLRLLHPVRWRLAAALFLMAVTSMAQLALPKAIAYFVDNIEVLKNTTQIIIDKFNVLDRAIVV